MLGEGVGVIHGKCAEELGRESQALVMAGVPRPAFRRELEFVARCFDQEHGREKTWK